MAKKIMVICMLFVLFGMTPMTLQAAKADNERIPAASAKQVVESDIKNIPLGHEFFGLWDHAEVVHRADVYDIHDRVMGYYFQLMQDDRSIGYYITGARTDITPILEYSSAPAKESLENVGAGQRLYYFGGENQASASSAEELVVQIENGINQANQKASQQRSGMEASTFNLDEVLQSLDLNVDPNSPRLWEQSLQSNALALKANPSAYYLAVPSMNQYQPGVKHSGSACGPTSLAMVIQYLHSIGLPVHDMQTYFNNSESDMINGMYNFLGTGIFGTSAGNMSYLTPQLLNMHMSGWTATNTNGSSSQAIATYQDRVISSRPPLVMWNKPEIFFWLDPAVNWHWQTGNGYRMTSSGVFEFGVKDPSKNYTTSNYYNWTANQNYFLFTSYRQ